MYSSFISLGKLIPRYLILFVAMVNGIDSLISLTINGQILAAAAAAKSLQSCPTLCNPIDGSPLDSSVPGILQARESWSGLPFPSPMHESEK